MLQRTKAIWWRRMRKEMRVWGNGEVLLEGNNISIGLINNREQWFKSHYIFNSIHQKMKSKHRSYYQLLCMLTGTCSSHLHGHSNIYTTTGHRLVCCVSGACLMAISKGTFCWRWKMAGKDLRRDKRGEGRSITFRTLFYLAVQCRSLPATVGQNIGICRFAATGLFFYMHWHSLGKKHMPRTACWCSHSDRIGDDDDDNDDGGDDDDDDSNNNNNNNNNKLCSFFCYITHNNSNLHVTQFVTFLLHALCDLSDWSNCNRTIMYVTIVDAHWNRENNTAWSIRTYGWLRCRYINLRESAQFTITLSQLYATLHIYKVTLVCRVI